MSKFSLTTALTCGFAALCFAGTANAATISVPNGSFENAGFNWQVPSDWQEEGSFQVIGTGVTAPPGGHTDGVQLAEVSIIGDADAGTTFTGGLSSKASLGTYAANTVYTLTFDVGAKDGSWWNNWQGAARILSSGLGIFTSSSTAATPVVLDTTDLQAADGDGPSYTQLAGIIVDNSHAYQGWKRFTVTLDTAVDAGAVGQDISVILGWTQNDDFNKQIVFDNVTLEASGVPEPASLVLAAFSGISMLLMRRRTV